MEEDFRQISKKVDEDWKTHVEREKTAFEGGASAPVKKAPPPVPGHKGQPAESSMSFGVFISSLSMQALSALGEMPPPGTQAAEIDLEQARYLIDILGMLQEKTRGNLSPEEEQALEGVLYELRTKYVLKAGR